MNIILLSGGSEKRLWPLSNDIRSKQFIKIFKKPEHSVPMGTEDAFAAIALATAYLHVIQDVPDTEAVVVYPVDPYVEEGYLRTLESMCEAAQNSSENLVLIGIEPTYPSEKFSLSPI